MLTTFLDGISQAFDETGYNKRQILNNGDGYKGKLNHYGVKLFYFKRGSTDWISLIKYSIYLISWILKIFSWLVLDEFRREKYISRGLAKFVIFHRKIHFTLMNLIVVDLSFYGTRQLIHAKLDIKNKWDFYFTGISYIFAILDMVELAWLSTKANIESNTDEKIEEKKKDLNTSESGLPFTLTERETNKKYFSKFQRGGFGIRDFFYEEHMLESVMSAEKASAIGYVRIIDFERSFQMLADNAPLQQHATGELKKDPKFMRIKTILLANFFFLFRVILYHIILVALPQSAEIQLAFLIAIELFYLGLITINYSKYKYLNSCHLFISKITQCLFLIIFHLLCLTFLFKYRKKPVPIGLQKVGIWSIIVSIGCEYVFLLINFFFIFKAIFGNRKKVNKVKAKGDKVKEKEKKGKKDMFKYKWVRKDKVGQFNKPFFERAKKLNRMRALGDLDKRNRRLGGADNAIEKKERKLEKGVRMVNLD